MREKCFIIGWMDVNGSTPATSGTEVHCGTPVGIVQRFIMHAGDVTRLTLMVTIKYLNGCFNQFPLFSFCFHPFSSGCPRPAAIDVPPPKIWPHFATPKTPLIFIDGFFYQLSSNRTDIHLYL